MDGMEMDCSSFFYFAEGLLGTDARGLGLALAEAAYGSKVLYGVFDYDPPAGSPSYEEIEVLLYDLSDLGDLGLSLKPRCSVVFLDCGTKKAPIAQISAAEPVHYTKKYGDFLKCEGAEIIAAGLNHGAAAGIIAANTIATRFPNVLTVGVAVTLDVGFLFTVREECLNLVYGPGVF